MKKILVSVLIGVGSLFISAVPALAATGLTVRAALCKAIIVDSDLDKVLFMDSNGDVWEYPDADDINAGEFYSICFASKETDNIEDDEILGIRYEHCACWR